MAEYDIKTNCRIEELTEEEQLIVVRLVNHLASHPVDYRRFACEKLEEISQENPWCDDLAGFDKETFLKDHPIGEEKSNG